MTMGYNMKFYSHTLRKRKPIYMLKNKMIEYIFKKLCVIIFI